ncbi:replicative helicase loader/inhibitor [Paenibacillus filicis]|uniref:Replicative helicase loader/inhibitor n=1 Tax=Paenibacillus filicis TaxID=669464 RepID=A0ABU9DXR4_9BACL
MNRDETIKLLDFISGAYPGKFPVNVNVLNVWSKAFADQDFQSVMWRAEKFAAGNDRPPAISNLVIKHYPVIG